MVIFLIILFILQLITFYFIALLYMRMAKFDKLETKQQKLMSEMDDAIAAYLTELKDENDRLIRLLEKRLDDEVEPAEKDSQKEKLHMAPAPSEKGQNQKPVIPVQVALQSYKSFSKPSVADNQEEEDDRSRALKLQKNGWSVEEIARELGKGKTEIELILKFK
ncbi:swarming motility protein SwrB [Sporosarcina sp. NCCP-2222]|uniref:DUF6115 domain-containing protein n=1 Tax=Sporosarcina sp. NCCP-2222 TaxID=2935073 RepID=UPI00208492BF|nr:hypothetical protein [Sporosarcina sp. NCCP-2222]GKV55564.1 swarming motility protein SwrB [Sporosarcina sp. NCCP-2222]